MNNLRKFLVLLSFTLVLGGIGLIASHLWHAYTLVVDGQTLNVQTIAFSLRGLLAKLDYTLQPEDRASVEPDLFTLTLPSRLTLTRARLVEIDTQNQNLTLQTAELLPANLLQQAGIRLFPKDVVTRNGEEINPYLPLPDGTDVSLVYQPAKQVTLEFDGSTLLLYTQKSTLSEALTEASIHLQPADRLSAPPETLLKAQNTFSLAKAQEILVTVGSQTISGLSAAASVGEALRDLGVSPQYLDRVTPPEDEPLPADGRISLVQGTENISLVKDETTYGYSYQLDPEAELDSTSVITPGQLGLVISRQRSRLENGVVVQSSEEAPWKASDPADAVLGWGTMVVVKTEVVDGQTLEYWRKVSVYATSYHPSEFSYGALTRSGLSLTKGIVAVAASWYNGLELQPVYVPGYGHGIIGDSGYGIPGQYWIDLGYDDENYVSWHEWTVIYFLTPVPAYVTAILP